MPSECFHCSSYPPTLETKETKQLIFWLPAPKIRCHHLLLTALLRPDHDADGARGSLSPVRWHHVDRAAASPLHRPSAHCAFTNTTLHLIPYVTKPYFEGCGGAEGVHHILLVVSNTATKDTFLPDHFYCGKVRYVTAW